MQDADRLAYRFEEHRPRLVAVAHRMLGSLTDAEDAVQNAWLRLSSAEAGSIDNLGGWLTTVVGRECLHLLRSRRRRREELVDPITRLPDPIVTEPEPDTPEQQAVLTDSVGLALLTVLDSLGPAERVALVMHDMFGVPFDEIASLVDRTPAAARQLASRARRRVRDARPPEPEDDPRRRRRVVEAFYAAIDDGDLAALLGVLDTDVIFHADQGPGQPVRVYRGAATVSRQSQAAKGAQLHPVLVGGAPGVVTVRAGRPVSLMAFTVIDDRVTHIHGIRDPERVGRLIAGLNLQGW